MNFAEGVALFLYAAGMLVVWCWFMSDLHHNRNKARDVSNLVFVTILMLWPLVALIWAAIFLIRSEDPAS